jgi:hypothetical protein
MRYLRRLLKLFYNEKQYKTPPVILPKEITLKDLTIEDRG